MNRLSKVGSHAPYVINVIMGANAEVVSVPIPIDDYLEILEVRESHTVAGSDGGAVTLTIEKLTGTVAAASGANMFKTSTINLKGTANTVQRITSSSLSGLSAAQKAAQQVSPGDRISLTIGGTPTAVTGVGVTIVCRRTRPQASQAR